MNAPATERADQAGLAVRTRVRVYPGTEAEALGVIVEDFGDSAGFNPDGVAPRTGERTHRWAVMLDAGNLVLVDEDELVIA
ncbi:hypothetical protein [uncultured Mycolicibacterium sp.]|jgi:hypothetical protein|uniref:hypothetical protein n=1 Tax=uncultured Mycolicibacterium sp. TaxID=2320817 RepID=UPI002621C2AB|nr:hypothetical protein [uncultured Mycolicibacterium sp.]